MKKTVAVMLALGCLAGEANAGDTNGTLKNQSAKQLEVKRERSLRLSYLLYLPPGYEESAKAEKQWPLMLFLHGAGERGNDLAKVTVHGPPKLVANGRKFEFILVSPQCPAGQTWDDETLLALLDEVTQDYRVDEDRVYLTGLSMGGYGTWSLGTRHPERFAAIAPICGGGSILPVLLPEPGGQAALRKLPVWAFHGAKDQVVPVQESERMVGVLRRIGNEPKLTIYPEAGHDSWTEAYDDAALYEWLLMQKRE